MTGVELVLFFGPPFVGKTLYYLRNYSKTHCWISAREFFEKDKATNLRHVILKAVGFLCQGKSVVIDDENWYIETRKSYSSLVKQKVPNCILTLVQFLPEASSSYPQCLWSREWTIVDWTFLESRLDRSQRLSDSNEGLDCWFAKRKSVLNPPEFPTASEGFSMYTVKPEFTCNTSYKFNLPGLFVQWEAIIEDGQGVSLTYKPAIPELLNKWFSKNPSGRLLVIGPKSEHDKEILVERKKQVMLQLASQLSFPMYFTFIDVKHQPDQFSKLPHPGVLAFLQRLHTIHLYHKSTMYIYQSEEHYKAANLVGVRAIKGDKLFSNPHLIDAIYCGEVIQTLPFLKDLQQINCRSSDESGLNHESEMCGDTPSIPFLSRARKSSSCLVWRYCYGKVNGVCFKDKLILERYQTQYALAAQPALPPGKTSSSLDRKRENICTAGTTSSVASSSTSSNIKGSSALESVDLREVAETPGRYQGGFLCKEKIFDMNVEVVDYQLKISCKCMGSSGQSYDVEAIVSDSSGLVKAHCSCPDPVSKNGRCKHVIGLLLNYRDRDASISHEKENESSASENSETSRSLPSSMQSTVKSKGGRPNKGCSSKATKKKKTPKYNAKTLYCMSQEELLETAKEILEKHKEPRVRGNESPSTKKADGNAVLQKATSEKERTVLKRSCRSDVLEELIFGCERGRSEKIQKKTHCNEENRFSFAEDTPPEILARKQDKHSGVSAIIPDSLVPETVSVIPESIEFVDEGTPVRQESSSRNTRTSRWEKTDQDFLHELI